MLQPALTSQTGESTTVALSDDAEEGTVDAWLGWAK